MEDYRGRPSLRFAVARKMQRSCIDCHNTHEDSTKRDWKEGDVRGVLEIIRPLDRGVETTREGLRATFTLMGLSTALVLVLSIAVLLSGNRRRK